MGFQPGVQTYNDVLTAGTSTLVNLPPEGQYICVTRYKVNPELNGVVKLRSSAGTRVIDEGALGSRGAITDEGQIRLPDGESLVLEITNGGDVHVTVDYWIQMRTKTPIP